MAKVMDVNARTSRLRVPLRCRFRFRFPRVPRQKCRRLSVSGVGRQSNPRNPRVGRPSSPAPVVISQRSPRAGGCKSSPQHFLTFNLVHPLIWPQPAPTGRPAQHRPEGPNRWANAASARPQHPSCHHQHFTGHDEVPTSQVPGKLRNETQIKSQIYFFCTKSLT